MLSHLKQENVTQFMEEPFYGSYQLVVAVGHNKSCAVSGRKKSFAGPEGQLDIQCWSQLDIHCWS